MVVRLQAIDRSYPGWLQRYVEDCPSPTFCADDDLARVGFMSPYDVQRWVTELTEHGPVFVRDGRTVDIAVVDQMTGQTAPCDWLEFQHRDDAVVAFEMMLFSMR